MVGFTVICAGKNSIQAQAAVEAKIAIAEASISGVVKTQYKPKRLLRPISTTACITAESAE